MEDIRLELYSVSQVKSWLFNNANVPGLSEKLIAKQRAYAIVSNPYAKPDLKIISAIFVNNEIAAYTYLFPDQLEKPAKRLVFWNTVLYCNPKYEGRGYAFCVIGQLTELYGPDYFDLDAVEESVEDLKFAGLQVDYIQQYILSNKSINSNSIKGKLALASEKLLIKFKSKKSKLIKVISSANYAIKYSSFIDDEQYEFIKGHSYNDLFLRSKEMFNWILTYPFMISSPVKEKTIEDNYFTSTRENFQYYTVSVYKEGMLVGLFILNNSTEILYLNYIYYEEKYKETVFLAVAEHVLKFNRDRFFTADYDLFKFLEAFKLYPKTIVMNKSFAYPQGFTYDKRLKIQAGEGDNIT